MLLSVDIYGFLPPFFGFQIVNQQLRILVIGNFLPDQQQSMIRFASLLVSIYSSSGDVTLCAPRAFISLFPGLPNFARKYLAYIDKLILFPLSLLWNFSSYDLVHIADHSNAFYSFCTPGRRCIVTCHDLLAVRGAMGDQTASCQASPIGIWLQRLIIAGLRHADAVAFDSSATFHDYKRLIDNSAGGVTHTVIPIPLNAPFSPDPQSFCLSVNERAQLPKQPYLLMVGSSLPRKNRDLAINLLLYLGANSPYQLVFAGAALTAAERNFHETHPLGSLLISITGPSHPLLNLLYCQAHALLFPSFSEGFGWPLVEAQTCCCPVIASTTTSIPEVAGEGALFAEPNDVETFAAHVQALECPDERARLISLGLINTRRYDPLVVGESYRRFAYSP